MTSWLHEALMPNALIFDTNAMAVCRLQAENRIAKVGTSLYSFLAFLNI
jgi:hypothetical protein